MILHPSIFSASKRGPLDFNETTVYTCYSTSTYGHMGLIQQHKTNKRVWRMVLQRYTVKEQCQRAC